MKSKMSKEDISAKQDVLKELMQMAMDEMRNKNKHGLDEAMKLKKVSVMAPDKEGIEQGLDKAKEVVGELPMNDHESEEDEDMYLDEDDANEMPMSDEEKKELLKKMLKE